MIGRWPKLGLLLVVDGVSQVPGGIPASSKSIHSRSHAAFQGAPPPPPALFSLEMLPAVAHLLMVLIAVVFGLVAFPVPVLGETPEISGWSKGPNLATCRAEHAVALLDGSIYVIGGLGALGNMNSVEVLDPGATAWRPGPAFPLALHHTAAAVLEGTLYVSGGWKGSHFAHIQWGLWALDSTGKSWIRKTNLPAFRAAHAMTAIGGFLYVSGGTGPGPAELWRYDPAADRWSRKQAPMPAPREHLAAVVLQGKIHAMGGRWKEEGHFGALNRYDPATDRWTSLPPMPTPRGGFAAGVLNGRIHTAGGDSLEPVGTLATHEVYHPATRKWSTLAPLPTSRQGAASAVRDGAWYVIGGAEGPGIRTMFTVTCTVDVWRD